MFLMFRNRDAKLINISHKSKYPTNNLLIYTKKVKFFKYNLHIQEYFCIFVHKLV